MNLMYFEFRAVPAVQPDDVAIPEPSRNVRAADDRLTCLFAQMLGSPLAATAAEEPTESTHMSSETSSGTPSGSAEMSLMFDQDS